MPSTLMEYGHTVAQNKKGVYFSNNVFLKYFLMMEGGKHTLY